MWGESLPEIALCCFVKIEDRLESFRVSVGDEEVEDEICQKYELNDYVPDVLGREKSRTTKCDAGFEKQSLLEHGGEARVADEEQHDHIECLFGLALRLNNEPLSKC